MPALPGQKMVGAYVEAGLADRFKSWARRTDRGASAALRRMILPAVDGVEPSLPVGASDRQIGVRLKDPERITRCPGSGSAPG